MRIAAKLVLLLLAFVAFPPALQAASCSINGRLLSTNTCEMYQGSMKLAAESFDAQALLVRAPPRASPKTQYMVRESSFYAVGLLARNQPGDRALALAILDVVLKQQYLDPSKKWYGTFKRSPEEPMPGPGSSDYNGFDPNWRMFIGTSFEMALIEFGNRIPAALQKRLHDSIDIAITGEIQEKRLDAGYSNIALMYGALWDYAAASNGRAEWKSGAAAWTEKVNEIYRRNNAFLEYNAPTYYGIDIYGLALWRNYGSTERMRIMGAEMEASLWNDIADFYQPSLRNISGPYDRTYGMDMERYYPSPTGVWFRMVLPASQAPLPEQLSLPLKQIWDIWPAPLYAILGARIPAPAMAKIIKFAGPHQVTRTIDDKRVATAWIGQRAMWGGEATSLSKGVSKGDQFTPATLHWRLPTGRIAWMKLAQAPRLNVTADHDGLTIEAKGNVTFRIAAGEVIATRITPNQWDLPGMRIDVESDGAFTSPVPSNDVDAPDGLDITYRGISRIRLKMHE